MVCGHVQGVVLAILRVLGCKDKEALAELLQGLTLNKPGGNQDSEAKWVAPESVLGRLRDFLQADSAAPLEATTSSAAIMSASASGNMTAGVVRREVCP